MSLKDIMALLDALEEHSVEEVEEVDGRERVQCKAQFPQYTS